MQIVAVWGVLKPAAVDQEAIETNAEAYREKYAENYNYNHQAVLLPELEKGVKVYIREEQRFLRWKKDMLGLEPATRNKNWNNHNAQQTTSHPHWRQMKPWISTTMSQDKTVCWCSRICTPNQQEEMLYY